jgi:hypothetical protein
MTASYFSPLLVQIRFKRFDRPKQAQLISEHEFEPPLKVPCNYMEPNEQAIIASSSIFPAINGRSSIETISDRGAHCQNLENTMNVMDSQLYPAYKSLAALRQRILN